MRRLVRWALVAFVVARAAHLAAQAPLGGEFRVNTYTTGYQWRESVAALPGGGFVVVWDSPNDGSSYGIFGQRFAASGAPLGGEFTVNTYTTSFQLISAVASLPSGFVVVWRSETQDGSGAGVFGQRFDAAGAPLGAEFPVNTYTTSAQDSPAVAADGSGNFVVIWASYGQDGNNTGVFGQRYASSGAALGGEFLVNSFTTGRQYGPRVAIAGTGDFLVAWSGTGGEDGNAGGVFGQRYASSGAALGGEFQVNVFTTAYQAAPDVAAGSGGGFVVAWESGGTQDGSSYGVFARRYAGSGAPLDAAEFRVNTYTTNLQGLPAVATDGSGNFVVAWTSNYEYGARPAAKPAARRRPLSKGPDPLGGIGIAGGIFAQRFGSSGLPLGPEFRVNTYTTSGQSLARVAVDATGGFVVVWSGNLEDGSQLGVFGQRYGAVLPVELTGFTAE